jgi:hypothetical protein
MRILAITYAFVPLRFPATFRLLKWFKGLDELGHAVTVLCVHPDSFEGPKDWSLGRLVSPSTNTVQVRSPENSLLYRALRLRESWFYRLFEPRKMEWYSPGKRALEALDLEGFDVVLSCSQPPVGHLLGRHIKKRTGLPWVAYFSDPWVNNPFWRSSPRIKRHNTALEREVVGSSDRLVFPSPDVRDLVVKGHSSVDEKKCEVLPHCYVPAWYELASEEAGEESGKIKVLLTGNFYGPRTPIPFLRALRDTMRSGDLTDGLTVDIYGSVSGEHKQSSLWSELEGVVRFRGGIDYLSSLVRMKQADYLLLIDADTEDEGSVFFPSKLADYLGSGTPIVGLTPSKGVSARVLRRTGNTVCPVSDPEAIRTVVLKMLERDLPAEGNRQAVAQYDYRVVVKKLEAALRGTPTT